jgi:hypothetical protein
MLKLDTLKLQSVLGGVELPTSSEVANSRSVGQGIGLSPAERRAVELHAMNLATALYRNKGWNVVDKSASLPFDLLAKRDNQRRFIEVKGTTGDGSIIFLTHGEVRHADEHPTESVLIIVANVRLVSAEGLWLTSGGNIVCHEDPWIVEKSLLSPTQYRYRLPGRPDVEH